MSSAPSAPPPGLLTGLIVLGAGVAALFDGVAFHQLLQWHHMLSGWHRPDTVQNLELNTRADGWFHVAAATVLAVGVLLVVRSRPAARPLSRLLVGAVLLGFGGFNVVEGIVDHLVLGVHHVREGADATAYDLGFLAVSALIAVTGAVLAGSLLAASENLGGRDAGSGSRRPGRRLAP